MPIPDSLIHKLALFRARGTTPDYRLGLFSRDSWLSVLFGQGLTPGGYDPLADTFDLDQAEAQCADFKARIDAGVAAMPAHRDTVRAYSAAESAAA
jgi:tryptophan halogenase